MSPKLFLLSFVALLSTVKLPVSAESPEAEPSKAEINVPIRQTIEGSIQVTGGASGTSDWIASTKVVVDGGKYYGFVKSNGEFEIHNVLPGSYLVEVLSPNFVFDPVRVDISSKSGKIRARKVNFLKVSAVTHLPYPLGFKAEKQAGFFEKKESWSILSTLKNPMVLLLVAPLVLMVLLPRLMKSMDPESQKEMQESMNAIQQGGSNMPSLEEAFTNWFGGGQTQKQTSAAKKNKSSNSSKKRRAV